MRIIHSTLFLLAALVALTPSARAADGASVQAVLIIATKEKAPADPRLAPYEATLQRNLPESSFRYAGEGSAAVPGNGRATISLGQGHRIELQGEGGGGGIRLKVVWLNGTGVVMNNSFTFQPGVPVVLGRRPSGGGDVPIVIVIAR